MATPETPGGLKLTPFGLKIALATHLDGTQTERLLSAGDYECDEDGNIKPHVLANIAITLREALRQTEDPREKAGCRNMLRFLGETVPEERARIIVDGDARLTSADQAPEGWTEDLAQGRGLNYLGSWYQVMDSTGYGMCYRMGLKQDFRDSDGDAAVLVVFYVVFIKRSDLPPPDIVTLERLNSKLNAAMRGLVINAGQNQPTVAFTTLAPEWMVAEM